MPLFDSHAHLNFQAYNKDRQEVIKRTLAAGMKVVNVGSQLATSRLAIELAQEYAGLFAAVALHPIHVGRYQQDPQELAEHLAVMTSSPQEIIQELSVLATQSGVVAIGETGLDYFRLEIGQEQETINLQKELFEQHIALANKLFLPVILHCRGTKAQPDTAYLEMLEILKNHQPKAGAVIHCFGASQKIASQFIDLGYYLGVTGIITFPKIAELQSITSQLPVDRLLIETDAPYLAPEPHRGQRNEPLYVELVARKIADLRNISYEQIAEQTFNNATKLFKLK